MPPARGSPWFQFSESEHRSRAFFFLHRCNQAAPSLRERLRAATLEPAPPRRRSWLHRSGGCTIPIAGCSPCPADCTGGLTVGMTRDFADGEASGAEPSHTCGTAGVRHSVRRAGITAWSGTWRRLVGGARCARTSPKLLRVPNRSPGPFLTNPMPPASKCEHRANPVYKKTQRRTTAKTKASPHRH
jgi:hypothetical protein